MQTAKSFLEQCFTKLDNSIPKSKRIALLGIKMCNQIFISSCAQIARINQFQFRIH